MRPIINTLALVAVLLSVTAFEAQAQVKLSLSGRTLSKSNEAITHYGGQASGRWHNKR